MKHQHTTLCLIVAASALIASIAVAAAQNRAAVAVPGGLAISEFAGYEAWQAIAPSATDHGLKVIVGNPALIKAYRDGIPANGQQVPDGARMAKIEWAKGSDVDAPYAVTVPAHLVSLAFMVKDAKRFADSGGWGYAKFEYDTESNSLTPVGTGSACGYACHTRVKARDFVFTRYGRR